MLNKASDFPHSREHGACDSQDNIRVKQSLLLLNETSITGSAMRTSIAHAQADTYCDVMKSFAKQKANNGSAICRSKAYGYTH
jgi:hypothetical protein